MSEGNSELPDVHDDDNSMQVSGEPAVPATGNLLTLGYPVSITPHGTIRVVSDPVLIQQQGDRLNIFMPPTTPVVASRATTPPPSTSGLSSGGSSSSRGRSRRRGRGRGRSRRSLLPLSGEEVIIHHAYDSGSEVEGGDDDDHEDEDDDTLDIDALRLRAVARSLQEYVEEEAADLDVGFGDAGGGDAVQVVADEGDGEPNTNFEWFTNFELFTGVEEEYNQSPGPRYAVQNPVDLLLLIWEQDFVQVVVQETNRYAWQLIASLSEQNNISKNLETWYEVTVPEMYRYFGVLLLMAICPRASLKEYWTTTGFLGMPDFRTIISRNRFQMISRFLHFVDNETVPHNVRSYSRKVAKILPVVDHCNNKFQELYTPMRELSLDESLLLWKGRLSWVQCIRSKAARFGIKSYELCEALTGYLLKFTIYAGKDSAMHAQPIYGFTSATSKVVLKLMEGFLNRGHLLVMDNWYNQLSLTRFLKEQHTDVLGTLNRRRLHVPDLIRNANERQMPVGASVSCHCGDIAVTAWKDVKLVTTISTYHKDTMVAGRRAGQERSKPISVADYNKYMGGVDLKDQKLSMYLLERKRGMKWYIKVFRRLLNTSVLNTYIMYCRNPMFRVLTHRQFRLSMAEGLIARFPRNLEEIPRPLFPAQGEIRLNARVQHFPEYTELVGVRHRKRRCARCSARQVRTQVTIMCSACKVGLCIGRCWSEYHTLESLARLESPARE